MQTNPWMPGEIVFCWETGGKAPQRTWTVMADGTGLRPLYPEAPYEWITHEAVISKDEVAIAMCDNGRLITESRAGAELWHRGDVGASDRRGHRQSADARDADCRAGSRVVRRAARTGMSPDRPTAAGPPATISPMRSGSSTATTARAILLAGPQKTGADHIHPTFNADSTKIEIQSALISKDNRSLNICVVPLPKALLDRTYPLKLVPLRSSRLRRRSQLCNSLTASVPTGLRLGPVASPMP